MANLFENNRIYTPDDPLILETLGPQPKQAQMRHHKRGPAYYRLGRKIIYYGEDLNTWADAQRIDPSVEDRG